VIPKEKIEEVRDRASIVQVVSEYVPLKKRGRNHVGLCPFHNEKTPSFSVSEEKRIYYCFGCNEAGNAITFYMKKEGVSFPEAVRALARRYGVVIPEQGRGADDPREALFMVNRTALEYFARELSGPGGRGAREYLKKRGFEGEIIGRFSLGFAPDRWDGLAGFLAKKGVQMESAEKAGLLIKKDARHMDRFRARVIFPITDARGNLVAFGGRAIGGAEPKYLNSPESPVFKKGQTLYGMHQARKAVLEARAAIVVEGYFDLLAMHKNGFTNAVATMGTAMTREHLMSLKGLAEAVYALFDSDEAGRKAAFRALSLCLEEDMPCRAVVLGEGKDPDELLAARGPEAMRRAIDGAEPLMEFYLKDLLRGMDAKTADGKARYLDRAVEYLSRVRNAAERGHYAAFVATAVNIPAASVYEAIDAARARAVGAPAQPDQPEGPKAVAVEGADLKEMTILKVILKRPELFDADVGAALDSFRDPLLKEAGATVAGLLRRGGTLDSPALLDDIRDPAARAVVAGAMLRDEDGFIEDAERMLRESLDRVLNKGGLKESTLRIIRMLEATGRTDEAIEIKKRAEALPPGRGGSGRSRP
jgi:DNA primase